MPFFIKGEPATFATTSEKVWKQILDSDIPLCQGVNKYSGIALRFTLSSPTRNGHSFDLDNLVEPVFSVLIGKKRYFSGRRTNLLWWCAKKNIGTPAGVEIELSGGSPLIRIKGTEIFKGEYNGELPKSATSKAALSSWLLSQGFKERRHENERYGIHLIFPEEINIGEIATGAVKATIDCLWPIIGGKPGAPEDWRIEELMVEKAYFSILKIKIYNKKVGAYE